MASSSPYLSPTGSSGGPPPRRRLNEVLMGLPPSGIREFFDLVIGRDDIVSLGVGEPDLPTPWNVRESAMFALDRGRTSYTSNRGLAELRREIARYLEERFGVSYDPAKEILITVGVSQGVDLAMRALLNPGDEVAGIEPGYVAYTPMVAMAGGTAKCVALRYEDNFRLNFAELARAITPKTRAIMLNYPNNPVGSTFTAEECGRLAALAEKHDLVMVSDEVYAELTYDQEHVSMPTQPGARDRTILLSGFSKAFAMTGWRMGYAAGPADIIGAMTRIFQYSMLSAPTVSQYACIEALRTRQQNVPGMIEIYNQRRRVIVDGLRSIGVDCHMPEGAFFAFPRIRKFGLSSREFCKRLLEEEKVAIVPGTAFGAEAGEGFARCSYAAGFEKIELALAGIKRMINRL